MTPRAGRARGEGRAGSPYPRLWKLIFPLCYTVPMKRDEAISRLKQHEADLKRLGVEHLYMFGSTARGEAQEDSDVDGSFYAKVRNAT
jgi:Nucleotidyltransferase domain